MTPKRKNFLVDNYKKCYKFLKEIKWYFVFSVGLFFLFFLVGFAFPFFFREQIISLIKELSLNVEGKSTIGLMLYIFLNNAQASFFSLVLGIGLAILPLFTLIFNGYLLGFVGNSVAVNSGIFQLWRILPHGIFELPAIFFGTAIGIKIGLEFLRNRKSAKHNYKEGLRFFLFVILPLLIIAAIIEGILIRIL